MKSILRAFAVMALALLLAVAPSATAVLADPIPVATPAPVTTPAVTSPADSPKEVTPQEYYHKVWQLVSDNLLYQERLTNWKAWEHKYDSQLKTMEDAEKAANDMLDSLHDPYTFHKSQLMTEAETAEDDETNVVTYSMLPGNIGYIKITTFSSHHTADECKAALTALAGADGLVLDLRDNGGGYVMESWKVFSMLVDSGTFTTLKGRLDGKNYLEICEVTGTQLVDTENGKKSTDTRTMNMTGHKPIVVLVSWDTASASEMLAGALRDNGRATLVGTTTYGKGIAQVHLNLENGTSMQITFAKYYLPKGDCIHGVGIVPDVVCTPAKIDDAQIKKALELIQKSLKP